MRLLIIAEANGTTGAANVDIFVLIEGLATILNAHGNASKVVRDLSVNPLVGFRG